MQENFNKKMTKLKFIVAYESNKIVYLILRTFCIYVPFQKLQVHGLEMLGWT